MIYIIPGLGEDCQLLRYRRLKLALQSQGYKVKCFNPDWYKPLSDQIFRVEKNSIVIGFSFGAVLAYLIAKRFTFKKVIFASLSPIHEFTFEDLVNDLNKHMPRKLAVQISRDIKNIRISIGSLDVPRISLAGEYEKMFADIVVPKTRHRITNRYIDYILLAVESL